MEIQTKILNKTISVLIFSLIFICGFIAISATLNVNGSINVAGGGKVLEGGNSLVPAGTIMMWGGANPPAGWLLCDGSVLLKTSFPNLSSVLSENYTYGQDYNSICTINCEAGYSNGTCSWGFKRCFLDPSYFRLPDFRGVFPKGAGVNGKLGSQYTGTLGLYTQDRMQNITGTIGVRIGDGAFGTGAFKMDASVVSGGWHSSGPANMEGFSFDSSRVVRIGDVTEPASLGVNFIIKY